MNVIITGSTGFVGLSLLPYLSRSFNCHGMARTELETVSAVSLNHFDTIIHLAGKAHDLKNTSDPAEYYRVNFELTKNLFDTFLKSDSKKFIYISSVKAARDSVDNILNEDVVPNPQTPYGKSKLMAEQYIQSQPLPIDKSYYILRPCIIHGAGNKGNLKLLYQFVKKGIPYPLAGFNNKRSFLTVQNLCFIINEIIAKDIPSGIYNVADDEPISTNRVIELLSEGLRKKPKLWAIAPSVIKLISKLGDLLHLPLTTERLEKLTEDYVVSNDKIKKALGTTLPLTAEQGLLLTTEYLNTEE